MLMDLAVGLILIGSMIYGLRKGFIYTFIHTVGWVLALILAYIATPYVKRMVAGETSLYDSLEEGFVRRFTGETDVARSSVDSLPANLPGVAVDKIGELTDNLARQIAEAFAGLAFTVLVFLGLFIILKLVFWLVLRMFSKEYNDGVMNFFDGLFGLVFGFVKGMLLVFIFLALLVPVGSMLSPGFTETMVGSLDNALIAKDLYDNNFILLLLRSFFA